MAEPFLNNEALNNKYLPAHLTMTSFEFDSCSESNCLDFSGKMKSSIHYWAKIYFYDYQIYLYGSKYLSTVWFYTYGLKVTHEHFFSSVTDNEENINCYSGLTVTDTSGDVVFYHEEAQACKVSEFCQVVTYTVTSAETGTARK